MRSTLRWGLAALVLGVLGTALDRVHMASGVLRYPDGVQPWWVLLEMTAAALGTLLAARMMPRQPPVRTWILGDLVAFPMAWLVTSFFQREPHMLLAVLVAWWVSRVVERPRLTVYFSLACAAGGLAVEAALIALGVFEYALPDVLGVTIWLPAIYLHAGLLGTSLAAWLDS